MRQTTRHGFRLSDSRRNLWTPRYPCWSGSHHAPGGEVINPEHPPGPLQAAETDNPRFRLVPGGVSPVVYRGSRGGHNVRAVLHPFSQATIRDLCKAHRDYGRDSPYFRGLLRSDLEAAVVIPADLRQLFSCLLDSTEFKLWEAAWRQLLREALPSLLADPETAIDENGNALTLEQLMGEGRWTDPTDQASSIPTKALQTIREHAVTAFFSMVPDGPVIPYYKIVQGTKEAFTKFVERLTRAIEVQVSEVAMREGILREMVFANANNLCRTAILSLPLDPPPTIQDMLRVCQLKVPYMQGNDRDAKLTTPRVAAISGTQQEHIRRPLELTKALHLKSVDWTFLSVNLKEQSTWPVQGKELVVIRDCFELQEEKVQRMPPWKYLRLEIGKRTIVPQKLAIKTKWKDIPKKDRDGKDPLSIIEWVFLSHQRSKRMTRPQELVAELIRKARFRIRELAGCDFVCIHIPIGLRSGQISKSMLEHLLQENEALQFALDSFTGQISIHRPAHKIFNQDVKFVLSLKEVRSRRPLKALTVFTDASGRSHKSVLTWKDPQTQQWEADVAEVEGSPQVAELAAVVRAFERFPEPFNLVTDSAYVAGVVSRAEQAILQEVSNIALYDLLSKLVNLVSHREQPFFVMHTRSHTELPGFIAEGNRKADALAAPAEMAPLPNIFEQAKLSHQLFHQNAPGLVRRFHLTREQAKAIVAACPSCSQHAVPTLHAGVNPWGLRSCEVWQTDVTHFPEFGRQKYIHVSIDTFSGALFASAHTGEKAGDVIKHLIHTFSFLGIPKELKTDNGLAYKSRELCSFLQQWGVEHKTGIPHSPTGQAMVERTHGTINRVLHQQQRVLKVETPAVRLARALFTINFLNCSFEGLNPPIIRHFRASSLFSIRERPPVMVRDPESGRTEGPHDLVTWGRGYACVSTPTGPRWIPSKWPKANIWTTLAKAMGQDHICLSATSADSPLSTCLVGIPFKPEEFPQKLLQLVKSGREQNYRQIHPSNNMPDDWCEETVEVVRPTIFDNKPWSLPKGVFLICGDRAWAGIPPRHLGGPCTLGKLGLFSPNKTTLANWQRKISSDSAVQKRDLKAMDPDCDSEIVHWTKSKGVAITIFLPWVAIAKALGELAHLECWVARQANLTSEALSNLLSEEEITRQATLQNRAAIDYLLLLHGHRCEEFEGLCCFNLTSKAEDVHATIQRCERWILYNLISATTHSPSVNHVIVPTEESPEEEGLELEEVLEEAPEDDREDPDEEEHGLGYPTQHH
ncbi:hypothetical protein DUI87_03050 [Hirundo rustica rustica]|uniref:RNA-directed DNA polymerase n=1 Tax=Hirundo rustica rustica TaxID=333673 RepID=A0A3M0LT38_HIRRU|nr:hypothetical protein DUI87_03050 [Hirundo rustica rustica]